MFHWQLGMFEELHKCIQFLVKNSHLKQDFDSYEDNSAAKVSSEMQWLLRPSSLT